MIEDQIKKLIKEFDNENLEYLRKRVEAGEDKKMSDYAEGYYAGAADVYARVQHKLESLL